MKQVLTYVLILLTCNLFSQEIKHEKIQPVNGRERKLLKSKDTTESFDFDVYLGFINGDKKNYESEILPLFVLPGGSFKINETWNVGARFEYMLSRHIGIGLDLCYRSSGYHASFYDIVYDIAGNPLIDSNGDIVLANYTKEKERKIIRTMFRLNYHLKVSNILNFYSGFSLGIENTNGFVDVSPYHYYYSNIRQNSVRIASRVSIGTKLYFNPNFGAYLDIGTLGGGIIQTGISVKF
jgi:hypothetical protein